MFSRSFQREETVLFNQTSQRRGIMEPIVITLGALPLCIAGVLAYVFLSKEIINIYAFAGQMQKLIMANNLDRALKFCNNSKAPFALALREIFKNANRKHELDLLHEEGVITLHKYHNFLLLGWLGLLLAIINPALALIGAYNVADNGLFTAGLIMSILAAMACLKLIREHNHCLAAGKENLRDLVSLLHSRTSLRRSRNNEPEEPFVPPHLQERKLTDEEVATLNRQVDELDKGEDKPQKPTKPKAEKPPSHNEPDLPPNPPTRGDRGVLGEL
jgi:hypothetical protein